MSEMYWTALFCLLLLKISSHRTYCGLPRKLRDNIVEDDTEDVPQEDIVEIAKDNTVDVANDDALDLPMAPEDLPEAEPVAPGHTLLQPSPGSLMSAVKYPQNEEKMLVYGNLENLGITYGKTNQRVLYTGFRKYNDILDMLLTSRANKYYRKPILVYIRGKPRQFKNTESDYDEKVFEEENNASEILDDEELLGKANDQNFRRVRKNLKYRERESEESTGSSAESVQTDSSDYERNPGNPYTVYKDKYLQNWLWNHNMDGDHMNVNPYGPALNSIGPSGAALFFNRKWWYYNQDDYRPFD